MDTWTEVYSGRIAGRAYKIEKYSDGESYRVSTTNGVHVAPKVLGSPGGLGLTPVYSPDTPIQLHGTTAAELLDDLRDGNFTDAEAREILSHTDLR